MKFSADHHRPFGKTGLRVPPIVFGAAALGNVPRVIPDQTKLAIVGEWFRHVAPPVFIETAGDCGNGRALELRRKILWRLEIPPREVTIHHKFGWNRSGGAAQRIGYDQIRRAWESDARLLGEYRPQLVSIYRLDEYLAAASSDRERRFQEVLDAYRALDELKGAGEVAGIGAAASDWRIVQEVDAVTPLDFVELAGMITIMRHPTELLDYLAKLAERQIPAISTGLFECGFLLGGAQFNGRDVRVEDPGDGRLFAWRKSFAALCHGHGVSPSHACIQFALSAPGVVAVALNTTHPDRIAENVESATANVPAAFWASMKEEGLLAEHISFVG